MVKTVEELAKTVGGSFTGNGAEAINDVAPLEEAGPGQITFISDQKYLKLLDSTKASAVILKEGRYEAAGISLIMVKDPQAAFSKVIDIFRPAAHPLPGVHPKSEVHATALLGKGVSIQAFTVVEEGAKIGDGAVLYPGVYIGRNADIGDNAILYSGVAVREGCKVGNRVIIHCNSVIGSDGFGYSREGAKSIKIPQRGIVRIEDDAEIGACVTVDRATIGETVIGRGTKIDNLVQIAHNVKVGEDAIIVAQAGIAGSSKIGNRVILGGQVGIVGHINIGDGVMIGAKSGITSDVPKGAVLSGIPAIPHGDWLRAQSLYAKLPELKKKIADLEKRVRELEATEENSK